MQPKHQEIVERIQSQIKEYYSRKVPFRVYHGSTNSTRVLTFKRSEMVDISEMNRVLSFDIVNQTAIVEPNVPMDKLVDETLKFGFVPPIVTEFPGITVGGAIQGAAAESASHSWGCFSQTVNWMEMVLGNGEKVRVSPKENSELFYGTAGSYGSLGLITAAELKLIPAKKYVVVNHHSVASYKEAIDVMDKFRKEGCDFIECMMLSKDLGTVIIGNLSDTVEGKLRHFNRAFDPWYYMYAKKIALAKKPVTDSLPLKDYLFRYDRGAFWAAEMAFARHPRIPFNRVTRFLLDKILRTRKLYEAVQESGASHVYVCQDLVLPAKTLIPFMEFLDAELGLYPIGICPLKPEKRSPLQCNGLDEDLVYNVGVYGLRVEPYEKFIELNRLIEEKTHELGGKKWLYAVSYYTEDEFWHIYDKKWYDKIRKKYHATTLPDIYTRTGVKEHHEMDVRRAIYKTIMGQVKLKIVD